METSAKDMVNVNNVFNTMVKKMERREMMTNSNILVESIILDDYEDDVDEGRCFISKLFWK